MSKVTTPSTTRSDMRLDEIVQAAIRVFSERGFVAGTTAEISQRVNLTQPAIYHYVGSKDAFLVLICERVGTLLTSVLEDALAKDGPSCVKLEHLVQQYLATVVREAAAFSVYVAEARHLPADVRHEIRESEKAFLHSVTTLVADAQEEGCLDGAVQPWLAAQLLLGMMNWTYRWFKKQVTVEELADSILSFVHVKGCRHGVF